VSGWRRGEPNRGLQRQSALATLGNRNDAERSLPLSPPETTPARDQSTVVRSETAARAWESAVARRWHGGRRRYL
jgi:hypothetical protein